MNLRIVLVQCNKIYWPLSLEMVYCALHNM